MHGSMSAAGGNQASRLARAAQAPPADPTATRTAPRTWFSPNSGRGASLDRPAVVPASAEFCFGMNSSAALAPAPRSQGACRSLDSRRAASTPALSLS